MYDSEVYAVIIVMFISCVQEKLLWFTGSRTGECVNVALCYTQRYKQILDLHGYSLSYISIQIPREYSDAYLYRFSALLLTCFVIKHILIIRYFGN